MKQFSLKPMKSKQAKGSLAAALGADERSEERKERQKRIKMPKLRFLENRLPWELNR